MRPYMNPAEFVTSQQKKVEAEQKRLQYGMTTTYDVLNFQNDLTLAKVSLTQSIIDYNKSLTALDEATGKLLEKQGIEAK